MPFIVRCADYDTPSRPTREGAERLMAEIRAAGHCSLPHEVVEVPRRTTGGGRHE